jgi:SAM-dependent methyltransferase
VPISSSLVPRPLRRGLRQVIDFCQPIWIRIKYGGTGHYCPVCSSRLRTFLPFGKPPRPNALCPICGVVERHRLAWVFLQRRTNLLSGPPRRMLHFAPEPGLTARFRRICHLDYLSADLFDPRAMARIDIQNMDFPSDSFDVIYCSHVLQDIPDDRRSLAELYRVLRPGGWALIQLPIKSEPTFEDPTLSTQAERQKAYGAATFHRRCGPDYVERIESAGFRVTTFSALDIITKEQCRRLAVSPTECIYYCEKK